MAKRPDPVRPRALQPGDTIALVAPASPVKRERVEKATAALQERGYRVKTYGDLYRKYGYLAGHDATRAEELMAAFVDPEIAAIFPVRGGYGVMRMLDQLDYGVIRQNPKIVAGFSDITALHMALDNNTGLVTFHSPHPADGLGAKKGFSELSARTFWRAIEASAYDSDEGYPLPLTDDERVPIATMFPGKARGRLVGGNLALISALVGTPYQHDTAGAILLLEDVNEQPYRVDRMLSQMQLAGSLDNLAGVLLGQFTKCDPAEDEESLTLDEIFHGYFGKLGIPVLQNFPVGHTRDNATLPLGVDVEMDADTHCVTILRNPVTLGPDRS